MPASRTLSVGRDGHQESIAVADVAEDHHAEVVYLGALGTRQCALETLIWKLPSTSTPLIVVDEAGRCGDWLSRYLTKKGHRCWVVAPSLIPKKASERVNSHRRDAILVARPMRSGDLTPVAVPHVEDAAIRDLSRAREDARRDLKTARHGRTALLLRHDIRETGRATWGPAHLRWLSAVVCPTPAPQMVFQEDVHAVGSRRTPGRWEPIHGDQRDRPSS